MKKLLCILICFVLNSSMIAVLADAAGSSLPAQTQEFSALVVTKQLGIINDEVEAGQTVTRVNALKYMLNLKGITSYTKSGMERFQDVSIRNEYYSLVDTGVSSGIIKSDPNDFFRPLDDVTAQECATMILRAMGYSVIVDAKGGTVWNYFSAANQYGLLKGISKDVLTYKDFAAMICNSFDVGILENTTIGASNEFKISKEKSSLYFLGLSKGIGILTDSEVSSIHYTVKSVANGFVKIDNIPYYVKGLNVNKYLGYRVEYYYDYNDTDEIKTLKYVAPKDNAILTLDLDNDFSIDNNQLYYLNKNENKQFIDATERGSMIYNGKSVPYDYNLIINSSKTGTVTFVDNKDSNFNGRYGVVIIENYVNDIVASVDTTKQRIYLKYTNIGNNPYIELPRDGESGVFEFYNNGKEINISDIKSDQTISYAISNELDAIKVMVSDTVVKGEVTEKTSDDKPNMTVNGVKYYITNGAYNVFDSNKEISLQFNKSCTIYLNYLDKVVDVTIALNKNYAYMLSAGISSGLDMPLKVKLFISGNEAKIFSVNQKVKVNGSTNDSNGRKYTANTVLAKLRQECVYDLMVYTTNETGEIISIETPRSKTSDLLNDQDYFVKFGETVPDKAYLYDGRSLGGVGIYNSMIFNIPVGTNVDEDECNVSSSLVRGNNYKNVVSYDVGLDGIAKVVLVKASDTSGFANEPTGICTFERMTYISDSNGEKSKKIYYYSGGDESSVIVNDITVDIALSGTPYALEKLKFGDVFVFESNNKGNLYKYSVYYVNSRDKNNESFIRSGGGGVGTNQAVQLAQGSLAYRGNKIATLSINGTWEVFSYTSKTPVFIFNTNTSTMREATMDILRPRNYSSLSDNGQNIVINGNRHDIQEVYVYE